MLFSIFHEVRLICVKNIPQNSEVRMKNVLKILLVPKRHALWKLFTVS